MSHFRPQPPVYIGGRQPHAPRLGLPQSGPVPEAPPLRGAMAAATFSLLIASWQPAAEAQQPRPRLVPQTADQPPVPSRVNLWTIVDSWRAQFQYPQGYGEQAAIDPIVNPPPVTTSVRYLTNVRSWHIDPPLPQGFADIAPFIPVQAAPDQPPVPGKTTHRLIIQSWQPPPWDAQRGEQIAPLIEIPGWVPLSRQPHIVASWQFAAFQAQGYADIAPLLDVAANVPYSRASFQIVLDAWTPPHFRAQRLSGVAPFITADNPPVVNRTNFRLVVDSWQPPHYQVKLRISSADFTQPVMTQAISGQTVRLSISVSTTVFGPDDTTVNV